ncbi:uncharacterized protein RHIMIDRAFT_233439 [Rhizopus microsporus ATCC 52813]|uniref:Uncharacterized protein n=1 Tax=Rhizopus microsporus ATCC 52813 TaxID=1340429 RepID=A0A2G4TAH6_RHIZD|nr:uncharacterized protein RHIMIDRAFT_233439 [Rhizopus microsporus ATCC 52813]PHZ18024.1 hypothetical protein RHIMIDRAFT_233439 [Rhizopus microsporus ATCC 52813]
MFVFSSTVPCVKFPFAKEITSCFWAQRCLLLSSSTLATLSQYIEQLHPLAALGYFMCSQALSMNMLDYGKHDNTIKPLYTIAKGNIMEVLGTGDEKLKRISDICDNADSQFIKIKHCVEKGDQDLFEKALSYLDDIQSFRKVNSPVIENNAT